MIQRERMESVVAGRLRVVDQQLAQIGFDAQKMQLDAENKQSIWAKQKIMRNNRSSA